jgi:hypothetical protein
MNGGMNVRIVVTYGSNVAVYDGDNFNYSVTSNVLTITESGVTVATFAAGKWDSAQIITVTKVSPT